MSMKKRPASHYSESLFRSVFARRNGRRAFFLATLATMTATNVTVVSPLSGGELIGFQLECQFSHAISYADAVEVNFEPAKAIVDLQAPPVLADHEDGHLFEVKGADGARHFIVPYYGSTLAGEFFTVFSDGRSVRTQHYATSEKNLGVHSDLGTCEVIE